MERDTQSCLIIKVLEDPRSLVSGCLPSTAVDSQPRNETCFQAERRRGTEESRDCLTGDGPRRGWRKKATVAGGLD
jgi:hypothetical protein